MDALASPTDIFLRIVDYVQKNKLKTIAFIVSSLGAFFVASMDYGIQMLGFELWIVSNLSWIIIGARTEDYPLLLTFLVYSVFNIMGMLNRGGWC